LLLHDFLMRFSRLVFSSLAVMMVGSASAQTISEAQMRAANMARMQAEVLNGGLGKYSPADCMHQSGGADCLVSETAAGYRFRFQGGAPGWAAMGRPASLETDVLVSPDGRSLRVEYNGPIRTRVNP
jgi:hypothetical protein